MKPTRLIPIAAIGSLCGLTMVGVAPKVLSATIPVDTELALIVDYSSPDFANVKAAHAALFDSAFYGKYVANGPTTKSIAVSFWVYANGVSKAVDWTKIDSPASGAAFGALISAVNPGLATNRTDLGTAIVEATDSTLNLNDYNGDYKIFDLATNGFELDQNSFTAIDTSKDALDAGISAINSISTTQVPGSKLNDIANISNNNGNPPGNVQGFNLSGLTFTPTVQTSSYFTALGTKFSKELFPPVTPPPTKTPEPSALLSLLGLSFIPLFNKRSKKSMK